MTKRAYAFCEFLSSHVPPPPARVLEVGCGDGDLARALADRGFEVTAIDPHAPEGALFQRVTFESFQATQEFDAVVASVSLHHIEDIAGALDKTLSLLSPTGVLVLEEFAKEHFAGATARWYFDQRRSLAEAGATGAGITEDFEAWERESKARHADMHPASLIRAELSSRFAERFFEWTPYLYSWRLDDALEPLERRLIAEGAINATGLWYVGDRL